MLFCLTRLLDGLLTHSCLLSHITRPRVAGQPMIAELGRLGKKSAGLVYRPVVRAGVRYEHHQVANRCEQCGVLRAHGQRQARPLTWRDLLIPTCILSAVNGDRPAIPASPGTKSSIESRQTFSKTIVRSEKCHTQPCFYHFLCSFQQALLRPGTGRRSRQNVANDLSGWISGFHQWACRIFYRSCPCRPSVSCQ